MRKSYFCLTRDEGFLVKFWLRFHFAFTIKHRFLMAVWVASNQMKLSCERKSFRAEIFQKLIFHFVFLQSFSPSSTRWGGKVAFECASDKLWFFHEFAARKKTFKFGCADSEVKWIMKEKRKSFTRRLKLSFNFALNASTFALRNAFSRGKVSRLLAAFRPWIN